MIYMEAIPKFDTKSVIDINTKPTTWIGHKTMTMTFQNLNMFCSSSFSYGNSLDSFVQLGTRDIRSTFSNDI